MFNVSNFRHTRRGECAIGSTGAGKFAAADAGEIPAMD